MRLVKANESTSTRRQVYFFLVDSLDGITPATGEAGGQPQISTDGAAWTNTGIGTLVAIGNGRYYAVLTQAAVSAAGTVVETRYKSASTAECPGDSVQVVAFDPSDSNLGLTNLDGAISEVFGLMHKNAVIDNQAYDSGGRLTSARIRRYDSAAHALASGSTGLQATYVASGSYDSGGHLSNYSLRDLT